MRSIPQLLLALCLLLLTTVCRAETNVIAVSDAGFIVQNTATIDAPPAEVWQALVNNVDNWWPKAHSWWGEESVFSIEPVAGGFFCEVNGERSAQHMQIVFVDPSKLLRMTGGLGPLQGLGVFGALDWQFTEKNHKTEVTLIYRVQGYLPDGFASLAPIVANVQGVQLDGLVKFVEDD